MSPLIDITISTTTVFDYISFSARARCMIWRDIATRIQYVRSKDVHKQLAPPSLIPQRSSFTSFRTKTVWWNLYSQNSEKQGWQENNTQN